MSRAGGGQGGGQSKTSSLGNDQYTRGLQIFNYAEGPLAPDPEISKKEDDNIRLAKEAFAKTPAQDLVLPLRPGYGEEMFNMRTNYFQMSVDTNKELFRYKVRIEPKSDSNARALKNDRKRRQFYKVLFEDQPDFQARGLGIATDYADTLITCGLLYDKTLGPKDYLQVYRSEFEQKGEQNTTAQSSEQKYKVTVTCTGKVSSAELIKYINSRPSDPSDFNSRLDVIQAMNIIVAASPNKDQTIFQAGQNKFFRYPRNVNDRSLRDMYRNCDLTDGLIAVRGYYSSVRTSTSRILLNLNAQCSAFYPEINLLELMYIFAGDPIRPMRHQDLEEFIHRLRVRTVQITREKKTVTREKTIRGFSHKHENVLNRTGKQVFNPDNSPKMKGTKGATHDFGSSDSITFRDDAHSPPKMISVKQYFFKQYGEALRYPEELVVNCGTDDSPKWIPPERCIVMPGQPYRGTLSDLQKTNMLTVAARGPGENARRINGDGLGVIGVSPQSQTLTAFGITINPKMVSVHARLLPAPSLLYHKLSVTYPRLAEWNVRGKKFFSPLTLAKWSWLRLGRAQVPDNSWDTFQKALSDCGMGNIPPDPFHGLHAQLGGSGDDDTNDRAIGDAIAEAKKKELRMLWVILPDNSAAIYSRVKFWADVKHGIHTVCVLQRKLATDQMYYANVAHKFNLKLGGINHKVPGDRLGILDKESTMVVGIDVAHPTPKSIENAPSVVGMVANKDKIFGQWPGSIRIQLSRQEILKTRKVMLEKNDAALPEGKEDMVANIGLMMEERLEAYYFNNHKLPENILIYRDGVSEGQYQAVLDLELKPIQEICASNYKKKSTKPPKITIVIVAKRHHTRFYPTNEQYVDKGHFASRADKDKGIPICNPLNGTVVDRGITMQKGWDFYLQSHAALKGTASLEQPFLLEDPADDDDQAKPAHYVVLHDEIGLAGGQLEQITHSLCYQYQIATKAVSVCSPAYYADIICERGRCYLAKYVSMRGKPPGTRFDFDARDLPWTSKVHPGLEGSMYYI